MDLFLPFQSSCLKKESVMSENIMANTELVLNSMIHYKDPVYWCRCRMFRSYLLKLGDAMRTNYRTTNGGYMFYHLLWVQVFG